MCASRERSNHNKTPEYSKTFPVHKRGGVCQTLEEPRTVKLDQMKTGLKTRTNGRCFGARDALSPGRPDSNLPESWNLPCFGVS